jgi:SMC interacting uncharacterized protein involved in chromosome segregation
MEVAMKKSILIVCALLVTVVLLSAKMPAQAPPPADVNAALVREIHDLRLAIEKLASANSRVQILASRANQQEQRIANLTDQLNALSAKITEASTQAQLTTSRVEAMRQDLRSESDPNKRQMLQDAISSLTLELEEKRFSLTSIQAQGESIRQQIIREQTNLSDTERRLDELMR